MEKCQENGCKILLVTVIQRISRVLFESVKIQNYTGNDHLIPTPTRTPFYFHLTRTRAVRLRFRR